MDESIRAECEPEIIPQSICSEEIPVPTESKESRTWCMFEQRRGQSDTVECIVSCRVTGNRGKC